MIKIIIVDDHMLVRDGIRMVLESQDDFEVIGMATNGEEVIQMLDRGEIPDLIIADICMQPMDGIELAGIVNSWEKPPKVIILSMMDNDDLLVKSFRNGVSGYLIKNVSSLELLTAIRYVIAGGRYVCEEISMSLIEKMPALGGIPKNSNLKDVLELSERELEVLEKLGEGLTNHEISEKLFLSKRTVEGYRQSLLKKTNSRNTATLIKFAVENGLL